MRPAIAATASPKNAVARIVHFRTVRPGELKLWLRSLPKPVGIFAFDAEHGRQIADACFAAGLAVPDKVAILAGDNDELLCSIATPPLSAIDANLVRVGYEAARLLDQLMRYAAPPAQPIRIPPLGVVLRRSSDILAVDDPLVKQAAVYIRQNATSRLSVKNVAATVGCSRRNLDLHFQQALGRPVAAEICRVRLEKAYELVGSTNLSLDQIAAAAGFGDTKTLVRRFCQQFGHAPSYFRRKANGK